MVIPGEKKANSSIGDPIAQNNSFVYSTIFQLNPEPGTIFKFSVAQQWH